MADVSRSIEALAARLGVPTFVHACTSLLAGAPREEHLAEVRELTGFDWAAGDTVLDRHRWPDHWPRTWAARGLLHVWDDAASAAVVTGLADEHWRPAEMCLKVATRHDVAGAAPGATLLARHEAPRVRVQALRCLAVTGDTEHAPAVREALDDPDAAVRTQAARAQATLARRLDLPGRREALL